MDKTVIVVCAAVLLIAVHSDKCFSLETSSNENNLQNDKGLLDLSPDDTAGIPPMQNIIYDEKDLLDKTDKTSKRVVRQAYQGQTQLYPNLPTGPPYGQAPYPNYNNQNSQPGSNNPSGPYGQYPPSNGLADYNNQHGTNNYQAGYPNYNGYKSNNFTNYPTGPYGQYQRPQSNPWQGNGQQPNYNSPYGTNTQTGRNFSNIGPYGQSTPPNSWQNPYSSNNGQRPYGSNTSYSYPGYKPSNTYNNPSGRPPYNQPGQSSYSTTPNPYPGYPSPRPPYYPGQGQSNVNTRPSNQHSVIYDDSTKRPGQYPYNNYNASNWSGNTLNNARAGQPYNTQNGQSPQYFNSYPGAPQYGPQNSTYQRPPYQNPNNGQQSPNRYPGYSSDSATFNLANSGYNPSIPVRPPYSSPYGNGPYGNSAPNQSQYPYYRTSDDPTRVSPQNFNYN